MIFWDDLICDRLNTEYKLVLILKKSSLSIFTVLGFQPCWVSTVQHFHHICFRNERSSEMFLLCRRTQELAAWGWPLGWACKVSLKNTLNPRYATFLCPPKSIVLYPIQRAGPVDLIQMTKKWPNDQKSKKKTKPISASLS